MPAPTIDLLPDAPLRSDPDNWDANFEAWMLAFNASPDQFNALSDYLGMLAVTTAAGAYQGAYNAGTTYAKGQSVSYNGAIWVSVQGANTGHAPAEGAWWTDPIGGLAITPDTVTTFTNKTISADNNTINGLANSSFVLTDGTGKLDGSAAQKTVPVGTVVGTSDAQTLTNKTVTFSDNTLTGVASTSSAQSLTNKTISAGLNTVGGMAASSFALTDATGKLDSAAAQKVIPAGAVVGTTDAQTLTNKTLSAASNTFQGVAVAPTVVATGTIGLGATVALRSDGTVEVVSSTVTGVQNTVYTVNASAIDIIDCCYDPDDQKIIIVYGLPTGSVLNAIVGSVSGTTITFGAEFATGLGSLTNFKVCVDYLGSSKVVVGVLNNNTFNAVVGTISGSSISFGAVAPVNTTSVYNTAPNALSLAIDRVNGKVVFFYHTAATTIAARAATVSGTTFTLGTEATRTGTASVNNSDTDACFDSVTGKFLVVTSNVCMTVTVSGTTVTWGGVYTYDSGITGGQRVSCTPVEGGYVAIAYQSSTNVGKAIIVDINGAAPGFGLAVTFKASGCNHPTVAWDTANNVGLIVYADSGNSYYGTARAFTLTGATINLQAEFIWRSSAIINSGSLTRLNMNAIYVDAAGCFMGGFRNGGGSNYAAATVINSAPGISTNANNFVGFAQSAVTNGQSLLITPLGQIDTNRSGLTPGNRYYVEHDGTLVTSNTGYPIAGRALSATKMIVGL